MADQSGKLRIADLLVRAKLSSGCCPLRLSFPVMWDRWVSDLSGVLEALREGSRS